MIEDMQAGGNLGSIDHNLIRSEIAARMNAKWGEGEQKDAGVRPAFLKRMSYIAIKKQMGWGVGQTEWKIPRTKDRKLSKYKRKKTVWTAPPLVRNVPRKDKRVAK